LSVQSIEQARARLAPYLEPTPLLAAEALSRRLGREVRLKLETLQPTGAFKVRPALNSILANLDACRESGVITSSSGNFAQAVAWAAARLGVSAEVVMMSGASELKRRRTEQLGARVTICENTFEARWATTFRIQQESGRLLLHPYDSDETVAGDGTIGLELIEQAVSPCTVIVPISGGGLIAGIATAVKASRPQWRVVGVQAEANPSMRRSLDEGRRITTSPASSLADALAVATPGERGFDAARRLVDDVVLVGEEQIAGAVRLLGVEHKLVAEGGGAVSLAALLAGKVAGSEAAVCLLSGGNIAAEKLAAILAAPAA
jgi:threonine dehydratase